jgi:hypothetical protein
MRNEMSTALCKIESSRDVSPEALMNMFDNGLKAVVGAVENVMNGLSDGIANESREKKLEEKIEWKNEK